MNYIKSMPEEIRRLESLNSKLVEALEEIVKYSTGKAARALAKEALQLAKEQ